MNYARIDRSDRLQRLLVLLADGQWHGTLDIVQRARICAVNSAVAELRANGVPVQCRCAGRGRYEYRADVPPGMVASLAPEALRCGC
jgi:hypothetical protein